MIKPSGANAVHVPGSHIKCALKERGVTQKQFAEVVGIAPSHLSEILTGKRRITPEFASTVENLLGINSRLLLDMQHTVEVIKKSARNGWAENLESEILLSEMDKIINVAVLLKDKIPKDADAVEKLEILKSKYGISTPAQVEESFSLLANRCFRKSAKTGLNERMIATWVVKAQAEAIQAPPLSPFDASSCDVVCQSMVKILHQNRGDTKARIRVLLNDYGIGFCEVSKLDYASIDGYSFVYQGHPYIVITSRYDRIDNLAFTVMHELGHIYLGHTTENRHQLNIDVRSFRDDATESQEESADEFASDWLIPKKLWKIAPSVTMNPYVIQRRYTAWSRINDLNEWIVLGRLSHETGIYRFSSDANRYISK